MVLIFMKNSILVSEQIQRPAQANRTGHSGGRVRLPARSLPPAGPVGVWQSLPIEVRPNLSLVQSVLCISSTVSSFNRTGSAMSEPSAISASSNKNSMESATTLFSGSALSAKQSCDDAMIGIQFHNAPLSCASGFSFLEQPLQMRAVFVFVRDQACG